MPHTAKTRCDSKHCRIHWVWSFKLRNHVKFPEGYTILSSRNGWESIIVYCGPGAYLPKQESKTDTSYKPPF